MGLIFLAPLLGAAVGAAAGGMSGYLTDYGVNDDFAPDGREAGAGARRALRARFQRHPERVADALRPQGGELFYSSFAPDVEQRFRAASDRAACNRRPT